jgi:hypothetical protein
MVMCNYPWILNRQSGYWSLAPNSSPSAAAEVIYCIESIAGKALYKEEGSGPIFRFNPCQPVLNNLQIEIWVGPINKVLIVFKTY